MSETLPLPALLSAAFVAMVVEIDNAAEPRIEHRTTSFGGSDSGRGVWLCSIAMWFTAVRALAEADELTVAQVRDRTGLDTNVDGLRRWGYATVDGLGRRLDGEERPVPKPGSVLRLTTRGRDAAAVWAPLPAAIEQRWRDRFGAAVVDDLRAGLHAAVRPARRGLPDYLPILTSGLWAARQRGAPLGPRPAADTDDADRPLLCLLARALLSLTLDHESSARLALPVWADGLRLLTPDPVPVRDLPARAGVGTEAMTTVLKHLERAGCVAMTSVPGKRAKQVALTERGERARVAGARRFAALGDGLDGLRSTLRPLVGDGTRDGSPLFAGLEPGAANWRSSVKPAACLPWHPLVLHRGGYPDGS